MLSISLFKKRFHSYLKQQISLVIFLYPLCIFFSTAPMACASSWARDPTHTTAVTVPGPQLTGPPGNSQELLLWKNQQAHLLGWKEVWVFLGSLMSRFQDESLEEIRCASRGKHCFRRHTLGRENGTGSG